MRIEIVCAWCHTTVKVIETDKAAEIAFFVNREYVCPKCGRVLTQRESPKIEIDPTRLAQRRRRVLAKAI